MERENFRLVAADTLLPDVRIGEYESERLEGLARLLAARPETPTVLIIHHPPMDVPVLRNPLQFATRENVEALQNLIQQNPQILAILAGHTHRADQVFVGSVSVTTAPSIATTLREDDYPASHVRTPVYQVHVVEPTNTLTSRSEIAS